MLAAIANALFYDGRLCDGISAADRAPLIQGLPTLTVIDASASLPQQVPTLVQKMNSGCLASAATATTTATIAGTTTSSVSTPDAALATAATVSKS